MSAGVRGPLDEKDRAARANGKRPGDGLVSGYGLQTILRFQQRSLIFLLQERENRLCFQVILDNLVAQFSREKGFIEGQRNAVRQAHALDAHDLRSFCDLELSGHIGTGRDYLFIEDARRRAPAKHLHVLHEAAQLRQLLVDLGLQNESAFAAPDFDEASADQILDCLPNCGPANRVRLDQILFLREPAPHGISTVGNPRGKDRFHLRVKRQCTFGINLHIDIMTSLCHYVNRVAMFPLLESRWAPLPIRLIVGYGFAQHGYAKLSRGPDAFAAILQAMGVPSPHLMAWLTILTELLGGIAILLGAFVAIASIPMVCVMLVAMFKTQAPYGFSSIKLLSVTAAGAQFGPPGYEINLIYIACLATLVLGGCGPFALDNLIFRRDRTRIQP